VCAVQPRPIAFVSTVDSLGRANLAPFSFFTAGGANPPSVVYCPVLRPDGTPKDSLANAEATGEFVVNMVTGDMAERMNITASEFAPDVDEFVVSGLTPLPSRIVRPPRIAESPVHFECRVSKVIRLGDGPSGTVYVIGVVEMMHIDIGLWKEGSFEPGDFRGLGRMGGREYVDLAEMEIFEMARPKVAPQSSGEGSE